MKLAKPFLILNAVAWLPWGITCLINPALLAELTGLAMTSPTAITEVRTMYGGVQTSVGLFCLLGAIYSTLTRPALGMVAFIFAGLAVGRVAGFAIDLSGSEYTYGAMGFEIVAAVFAIIIFTKQPLPTLAPANA